MWKKGDRREGVVIIRLTRSGWPPLNAHRCCVVWQVWRVVTMSMQGFMERLLGVIVFALF